MWIIVATVLLLYLLGLLFICFLKTDHHQQHRHHLQSRADGSPSNADNINLSASSENTRGNDGMRSFYQRHHLHLPSPQHHHHRQLLQRYYQGLFFSRLVSSNFRHEEEENDLGRNLNSSEASSSTTSSPDPTRSSLFAYRQQQLRQIHHEINEMSYLLGASQQLSQSDDRARSVPVPIFGSRQAETTVQPLWRQGGSGASYTSTTASPYSYVHQLASMSPSTMTTGVSEAMTMRDSAIGSFSGSSYTENFSVNNASESAPGTNPRDSLPNSVTYSRERQRRLQNIRMELQGLSLQLNGSDCQSGNGMNPPSLQLMHGMTAQTTTATTAPRNTMLFHFNISPPPSGLTLGTSNFSPLIYCGSGDGGGTTTQFINGGRTSWSDDNDDLPEYESLVCLVDSRHSSERVVGRASSQEQTDSTPPPSYAEALHLYSFAELEERKK